MGTYVAEGGEEVMNYIEGATVLDGWVIMAKLGSGSFGTVYQIERKDEYGICERSALKVISVPQSPEDMKEILDEGMNDQEASTYFESVLRDIVREIAVMIEMKSCEHIVRYEAHKVVPHENGIGGDILIRMELLTSLPEYRRTHEMSENDVIRMGRDLADALMYCEKKGLIHRDIKPQNIFVTESDSFKLGDFGIARRMQRTTGASRKGTEDYMAPEVYLRRHYGTTVDIYSLGLVMYKYTNCGRLPFLPLPPTPPNFDDREQALQNRMNGVSLLPPAEAGESLSAIILKACAYDSAQRYRSAGELKADLDALSGGSVIGTVKNDTLDIVHRPDWVQIETENRVDKTVGGWTVGEKLTATEKTDNGKEDSCREEPDKVDLVQRENETKESSMFEKQFTVKSILKNAVVGMVPVIIVWLIIQYINGVLGMLSAGVITSIFAVENLLGIRIACTWVNSIYGQAIDQRSKMRCSQIKQICWKSVVILVGIVFFLYAWIKVERGAGIWIQDWDGVVFEISMVCIFAWPINLLFKMGIVKICLSKKNNRDGRIDVSEVTQIENTILSGIPAAMSILFIGIAVTIFQSAFIRMLQTKTGYYYREYSILGIETVAQLPMWISIGVANGVQALIRDCMKSESKKCYLKVMWVASIVIISAFTIYAIRIYFQYIPYTTVTIGGMLPGICYLLASVPYGMKKRNLFSFICIFRPVLMVIAEFVIYIGINIHGQRMVASADLLLVNIFFGVVMISLFHWRSKKYWKQ